MNLSFVIIYFFLYSCIGYLCESIYCSIGAKRYVNRGFLHGPYIPVYGFGALGVLYVTQPIMHAPLIVFLVSMIITSIIEYGASIILESLFHTKLWDYSHYRFHIRGRVCVINSLLFGILSLCTVYLIHPHMVQFVTLVPQDYLYGISLTIIALIAIDTTASIFSLSLFHETLLRIRTLKEIIESKYEKIDERRDRIREKLETELQRVSSQLRKRGMRLLDAFPGMKSGEFDTQISQLKQHISQWRKDKRGKNT